MMKTTKKTKQEPEKLPKGIRRHPSSGYLAQVCYKGVRKSRAAATLEEAIIAHAALLAELKAEHNGLPADQAWTLQDAFERTHQLAWAGRGGEQAAIINAQSALKFFGSKTPVSKINLDWIDDYVAHLLKGGVTDSTVNRKLTSLSMMLRTSFDRGKIEAMPKMPWRRESEHRIRFLSLEEEAEMFRILEQLGYNEHAEAFKILLYTGFRCGELTRLEARDIDLKQGTITLWQTKSGRPRTIPIVDKIRPIIEKRMASGGRLFPAASKQWFRWVWKQLRKHMHLEDDTQFVPHMLRHTCATRLAQGGCSMPVIGQWLGHSRIQTTIKYAHFAPKDLLNAAMVLGAGG